MAENLKFENCLADTCLLKRTNKKGTLIIAVYVDDILCIRNRKAIDCLKNELSNVFEVKDEGSMEEYVGFSILTNETGNIILHQPHLLKKIKEEFGKELEDVRTPETTAGTGNVIIKMDSEEKEKAGLNRRQQMRYRSGVGMLL